MFEIPRRGRQAWNFTTNVSKSSSEQIFFRKLSLGAPVQLDCINSAIWLFDSVEESDLKTDEFPFKASWKVTYHSTIASFSQIVNDLISHKSSKNRLLPPKLFVFNKSMELH